MIRRNGLLVALSTALFTLMFVAMLGAPGAAASAPVPPAAPFAAPLAATPEIPLVAPPAMLDVASAVTAYREGRYAEASEAFARLAEAEPDATRAGVLHCNAGTAAARAENLGEALWQLRRARMLLPRDPQTVANLERVRALLVASAGGPGAAAAASDTTSFLRTVRELPLLATLDETGAACAVVAAVGLLLLAGWRAGRLPRGVAVAALVLLSISLAWWWFARTTWELEGRRAVVIATSVNGRAEPSAQSETLFHLASGTVLATEEQRGDWLLVQSDTDARGWVPVGQVRPLR